MEVQTQEMMPSARSKLKVQGEAIVCIKPQARETDDTREKTVSGHVTKYHSVMRWEFALLSHPFRLCGPILIVICQIGTLNSEQQPFRSSSSPGGSNGRTPVYPSSMPPHSVSPARCEERERGYQKDIPSLIGIRSQIPDREFGRHAKFKFHIATVLHCYTAPAYKSCTEAHRKP